MVAKTLLCCCAVSECIINVFVVARVFLVCCGMLVEILLVILACPPPPPLLQIHLIIYYTFRVNVDLFLNQGGKPQWGKKINVCKQVFVCFIKHIYIYEELFSKTL